jgi:hypothetical protein
MKMIAKVLEADDAVRDTALPGRGTIQHPGFVIKFNDQHDYTISGSQMKEAFENIRTALGVKASSRQQYTIPVGPMIIYLNWMVDYAEITYDIRPLDYRIYSTVFHEHFGDNPLYNIKAEGNVIKQDTNGMRLGNNISRAALITFVKDLYSRNNLWGFGSSTFDADRYMCVQASRHLMTILAVLSDSDIDNIDNQLGIEMNDWIYVDVTMEPGYVQQTQAFVVENIHFARLCTVMGIRSTSGLVSCLFSDLASGNVLDLTDDTAFIWQQALNVKHMYMLAKLVANVIGNNPDDPGNYFIPYFHKFKRYRPSFYIPTDAQNVDHMKRMIVTGLAVIGVIANCHHNCRGD